MRVLWLCGICLILAAVPMQTSEVPTTTLSQIADLAAAPEGERVGVLLPGAAVRVLETRGGWTRISIEGWTRLDEVGPSTSAGSAAVSPGEPVAAAPSRQAQTPDGTITGSIFITDAKGQTVVGSGVAVRLVREAGGAATEVSSLRAECDAVRSRLQSEADALSEEGKRAMRTVENTSAAFEAYDEAKRQRQGVLREMRQHDELCDSRFEQALEARVVRKGLSGSDGRYSLEGVPPGQYALLATLPVDDVRHEWEVEVSLDPGQRLVVDLHNSNRARTRALPIYR